MYRFSVKSILSVITPYIILLSMLCACAYMQYCFLTSWFRSWGPEGGRGDAHTAVLLFSEPAVHVEQGVKGHRTIIPSMWFYASRPSFHPSLFLLPTVHDQFDHRFLTPPPSLYTIMILKQKCTRTCMYMYMYMHISAWINAELKGSKILLS